jgi:small subunit ribosomal protein S13
LAKETPDAAPEVKAKKPVSEKTESEDFRYIVRLANTDLDGHKTVRYGLTGIKGIGLRTATTLARRLELDLDKKMGDLDDDDIAKLQEMIESIPEIIPVWMLNRNRDYDSGEDLHLVSSELELTHQEDLNRLKKTRCYKGIRHENGHKVRGQRTSSNGRKGSTIGVVRKKK